MAKRLQSIVALNAYVGGYAGPGLPVWSTGFQRTYKGGNADGMVIKLNATGTNLVWSTYLGGSGDDYIQGLALDQYRQVYVSGYTSSPDFPLKSPIQSYSGTIAAPYQYFVATLSPSLSSIPYYSTYFGSESYNIRCDLRAKIAVDPALNVYLAGQDENNVQPTAGAYISWIITRHLYFQTGHHGRPRAGYECLPDIRGSTAAI